MKVVTMPGEEAARMTRLKDFARHPMRLNILALVATDEG
jgi:hypothetical protein